MYVLFERLVALMSLAPGVGAWHERLVVLMSLTQRHGGMPLGFVCRKACLLGSELGLGCKRGWAGEGGAEAVLDLACCFAEPAVSRAAHAMAAAPVPTSSVAAETAAPAPTSSIAETARTRYCVGHVQLIDLDALSPHPCNRGGLGVSSFH